MPEIFATAQAGDLWIADRNFSTNAILSGWHERQAAFIVREHKSSPNPTVTKKLRKVGSSPTGDIYEQPVQIEISGGEVLCLRRIEVHLLNPTDRGETVVRILTNLPKSVRADVIAGLYRRRWKIEGMFQWLESVLESEVSALGYPRAALFAFAVAVMAYNVLSLMQTAIECAHGVDEKEACLSLYYIAVAIRANHGGMMIAVPNEVWVAYDKLSPKQANRFMLKIAAQVALSTIRKHPRGPKKGQKKRPVSASIARSHVSTARVLKTGRVR
jgi:hypothetical protein